MEPNSCFTGFGSIIFDKFKVVIINVIKNKAKKKQKK